MKKLNLLFAVLISMFTLGVTAQEIIHDADHYVLLKQHGDDWEKQDKEIDKKLKALEKKHGTKPNKACCIDKPGFRS